MIEQIDKSLDLAPADTDDPVARLEARPIRRLALDDRR
jgi:hypothetical protein